VQPVNIRTTIVTKVYSTTKILDMGLVLSQCMYVCSVAEVPAGVEISSGQVANGYLDFLLASGCAN